MDPKRRNTNEEENVEEVEDLREEKKELEKDTVGQELENLRNLAEQLDNQLKRSLADYQNLQRRVQEEKAMWIKSASKDLLLKLLPVLDTLMLAQKHLSDKGLELSINQFLQVLSSEGVQKIETTDQEFDPRTMEAIGTQEVDKKQGKVIEEVRLGFTLYEQVLRPAQVIVGQ